VFTACGIMNPRCYLPVAWKRISSASRLPAVNIVGTLLIIINKPLLLHLVGCLHYVSTMELMSYCERIVNDL
jgi:hypothetical protein